MKGNSPARGATPPAVQAVPAQRRWFAVLLGTMVGLGLLKFGNVVMLRHLLTPPGNPLEWIIFLWPLEYTVLPVVCLFVFAAPGFRWRTLRPAWLVPALLGWLGWQWLSAMQSMAPDLSVPVALHFTACAGFFVLGAFCLGRSDIPGQFWIPVLIAMLLVLASGFEQHFGGLQRSRLQFELYVLPTLPEAPVELIKRFEGGRIYSTLFYPNTLAGAILLLTPPLLAYVWSMERAFTIGARLFIACALGLASAACLVWSGSKGGWLLALIQVVLALLQLRFSRRLKTVMTIVLVLVGLSAFAWRYSGYFKKGATSVGARYDYWRAAVQTAAAHPVLGSGPGSFGRVYAQIRRPDSEMTRVVHNDYLQQASDSGLPGFVLFAGFVIGAIVVGYHPVRVGGGGWLPFCVWLGVLGWGLQGLMEFGLYIPAMAWPGFTFLGWLAGNASGCRIQADA